jgi:UDP-glucose 4-epimerase
VYGERQNIADRYRNVVGIFMNNILQDKPLPIFGDGKQSRAFSYINDVAPIIAQSINNPLAYNEVFNIGADNHYTIDFLAHSVCTAMGVEFKPIYLPARNEVKHAYASHEKLAKIFNYNSVYSLESGLSRMAQWVKNVGARQSKSFGSTEINYKLPSFWSDIVSK